VPAGAPLLPLAAALACGIAAAPWLAVAPVALIGAGAALAVCAAAGLAAGRDRPALVALLAAFVAIGAGHLTGRTVPVDHIARRALPTPVTIEGRLAAEPVRWSSDRARLLIDVDGYRADAERQPVSGRVQLAVFGETGALGEGQRVVAEARLYRPIGFRNPGGFDYPAELRRDGILLVGNARGDRVVAATADTPTWPVAVRRWAVETIRGQLPETSAALLAGLLLGDRTTLPRETDDSFRRAGVYHLLAVSGFNVALVASSVFATMALVGVPRRGAALTAAVVLVGFALVVGGQPSVLRATVMGLLLLLSVLLERKSQAMNALALAALLLLLWSPGDLRDPGFQLSFAATAGIVYLSPAVAAWLETVGCPTWLARALGVSLSAQVAVTPVMLATFHQLSLIGVVANLLVVPLAAPATTLGMLALAASTISSTVGGLCFEAVWAIIVALRAVVWAAAAVPGAMVHLPAPHWAAVVTWYGALVLIPCVGRRRRAGSGVAALLGVAVGLSLWPWVAPGDGRLRVIVLDVGQGDAILVELPDRRRMLIDGGPGGARRFDVGERVIAPFLWNRATRRLQVVALSHSDADHAGGLGAVLRHFTVDEFWESGLWSPAGEETRRALERAHVPRRVLRAGERMRFGEALISVLNPDGDVPMDPNDASLVLRLDWRGMSMLLTGDLGWQGEERLRERARAALAVHVLKVAHHGSRFSSSTAFLAAAQPAVAIVSVGARNPFRHPAPEVLQRLDAAGARVYRTDRDGAVIVETDGVDLTITRWATGTRDTVTLHPEAAGAL
jgi:competence protein ComEC